MTLFVDCSGSEFSLTKLKENNAINKNIFQNDTETFQENFKDSKFHSVLFKNLKDIGDGFMLFKSIDDSKNTLIHLRCSIQGSSSNSIKVKLESKKIQSGANNLFITSNASVKNKARNIFELLHVDTSNSILQAVSSSKLKKLITQMDSDLNLNRFKFGIAYLDRFDTSEQQMLSNTFRDSSTSEAFSNFLQGLGDRINLKGWKGFAGGLDVSDEKLTGDHAIYRKTDSSEIIYHVVPWLPETDETNNNLERKRHFGNDTIVIIYSESLYAFEMESLLSRQIQVVLFVRFINRIQKFQIYIYSKQQNFQVDANPFYIDFSNDSFTELLVSLERQSYNNQPLIEKLVCMREFYIRQILNKFT